MYKLITTKIKKGFTLVEMLIVVAIIAVLVGVTIPVLNSQLEKSREATDLANVRAKYAEVMIAAISEDTSSEYYDNNSRYLASVDLEQKQAGWQGNTELTVGGVPNTDTTHWLGNPNPKGHCTIIFEPSNGEVFFHWNGESIVGKLDFNDWTWIGGSKPSVSKTKKEHQNEIISTVNKANTSGDFAGLYELAGNSTYRVSFTYDPHLKERSAVTSGGIIAKATLLWDKNEKASFDSGTGQYFKMDEDLEQGKVQYRYTSNVDGTVTYTATFSTGSSEKYYYGMNFGAMDYTTSTGWVDKSSALKFTGDSGLGLSAEELKDVKDQISQNFTLEKIK